MREVSEAGPAASAGLGGDFTESLAFTSAQRIAHRNSRLKRINAPARKRTVVFIDGQNLFHAARHSFGYSYPNYDAVSLARKICQQQGWELHQVRFYTGIPEPQDDAFWNRFWEAKLATMGHQGAYVFSRALRYRNRTVSISDGCSYSVLVGEEKGIDVRIALDAIHLAYREQYDVALLFSQDQDLSEVADQVRMVAKEQRRWIKVASAFPVSPVCRNQRGIDKTEWIRIDRVLYDTCIDSCDYRNQRA